MDEDTFLKTPGTTDLGKIYEDLNVSSLVLKLVTDSNIDNFKISSNDRDFSSFDDIVVKIKSAKNVSYALQLKHSEGSKTLVMDSLKQGSDFAISKYFQAYKDIKNDRDFHKYILFTNRKFNQPDGTQIKFEKEQFFVELVKRDVDQIINNSKLGVCYQFINIKNTVGLALSEEQQKYEKFFKRFYLYTNQANVNQLRASVSRQFEQKFSCSDDEVLQYQRFISEWSLSNCKKNMLNKSQMKRVIALCVLSKLIKPLTFGTVTKKMKCLREAMRSFDVTIFRKQTYDLVKQIWGDVRNELVDKLQEVNNSRKQYLLDLKYIAKMEDLSDINCTKLLWVMGSCPLIVLENACTYEIIQLCNEDKFVLLGNTLEDDQLQNRSVFRNLSNLSLGSEIYNSVTTSLKYSIQGKSKRNLQLLVEQDETCAQQFSTDDLLEMSTTKYSVGGGKEILPVPYVNRYLGRNVINFKYLREIDKNTIILIDSIHRNDNFKNRVRTFNLIEVNDYLQDFFDKHIDADDVKFNLDLYVKETESSIDEFKRVYEKNINANKGHYFSLTNDGNLEWIYSESTTEDLKPFLDENESIPEATMYSLKNKMHLVVGEPGMGKSVLIKNLKNNFLSAVWTVIFDSEDVKKILDIRKFNVNLLKDFILQNKYPTLKSFEKNVLQILMSKNQVVYVWDAIDEINARKIERITDIIFAFSQNNLNQVVTCRYYLKNSLERKFNVFSKKIIQFSDEQQSHYIQERLREKDHCENILGATQKIKNLIVNAEILGIPLQVYMLTELFREDSANYSKLSKDIFNVTNLYLYFINEKFNIYFKREGTNSETICNKHKNIRCNEYRLASLRALVPFLLQDSNECDEFLKDIRLNTDPVGIITEVTNENVPYFIHKSFAEYFVAVYMADKYNSLNGLRNIIFDDTLRNVRFFFDLLMAKNSPAHIAVMYKNVDTLLKSEESLHCKDTGQRNLLHLACSWGQEYPRFKVTCENGAFIVNTQTEKNYFISEEDSRYKEMLNLLLNKCSISEMDDLFHYNALTYAEKTRSLFAKTILLMQRKKKFAHFPDDYSLASMLYYAARYGYTDVLDLYDDFPLIKTHNDETLLHLSVCQEKFFKKILCIAIYKRNINAQDGNGVTAISKACQEGQIEVVNLLLSRDASINIPCQEGRTPLHYACQSGYDKIALRLIQYGTKVNVRDNKDWTPLHLACLKGHKEVVELLVNNDADVNLPNVFGWTSLHSACNNGHHQLIEVLKNKGCDINISKISKIPKDIDLTPLHSACWHGHRRVVEILIQLDADIDRKTKDGRTPLHYASDKGHESIIEMLCQHGANPNVVCGEGFTPLRLACNHGYSKIVQLLLTHRSSAEDERQRTDINIRGRRGWTSLHEAASKGHDRCVQLLLDHGADINAADKIGRTPLHYASQQGHYKIVQILIKRHCNVNAADKEKLTPLHLSCMMRHHKVVEILTKNEADVNALAESNQTPLFFACQSGHEQTVAVLLSSHPDVFAADRKGLTPLHIACWNGYDKIVQRLTKFDNKVNVNTSDGWTPLHYACQYGHVKIAKKLVSLRGNVNARTADKKTPLYCACSTGQIEIARFLVNSRADIEAATESGNTALHIACRKNHFQVAWYLMTSEAKVNVPNKAGQTPLHIACNKRHVEIVRLLISSGGNVNAKSLEGYTPLHWTCVNKDREMCQYLLDCTKRFNVGINVNAVDVEGKTPLHLACIYRQRDIFNLLSKNDATILSNNNLGPLHSACFLGNKQIVEFLLEESTDVNIKDFNDQTPLHYTCQSGHYSIASLLIQQHARIDVYDFFGQTPLHLASTKGHHQVVRLLIEKHAKIDAKNEDDETPLHNACVRGHFEVVKLLVKAGANVKSCTKFGATPLYLASKNRHDQVTDFMRGYFKAEACCVIS